MSDDKPEPGWLHRFTPQEQDEINQEMWRVCSLWNTYIHGLANGTIPPGLHPPPALSSFFGALIESQNPLQSIENKLNPYDHDDLEAVNATLYRMMSFGDMMFKFGQYAAQQGYLHANLTQCNCGTVADADLAKFIGNPLDPK